MPRVAAGERWRADCGGHPVAAEFAPDGKLFAVAVGEGPVTIFDCESGAVRRVLAGHGGGTFALGWHPGTMLLNSAGQDGVVRFWDADSGREIQAKPAGSGWAEHLAWKADGSLLGVGAGKNVRLFSPGGRQVADYPKIGGTVAGLAWKPKGDLLTAVAYGGVWYFDPAKAEAVRRLEWRGAPLALAWSPDGKMLAHGNQDASVHFWYDATGKDLQMSGYASKVAHLAWDPLSRYLSTSGGDAVHVWDCGGKRGPEGSAPNVLGGHKGNVSALAAQRRGNMLAAGDTAGGVIVRPNTGKRPAAALDLPGREATLVKFSPDDSALVAGFGDGTICYLGL